MMSSSVVAPTTQEGDEKAKNFLKLLDQMIKSANKECDDTETETETTDDESCSDENEDEEDVEEMIKDLSHQKLKEAE